MNVSKTKRSSALGANLCLFPRLLNWKVLVIALLLSSTTVLTSCTEFEESYYEQADGENGLGPGCKLVGTVIVCE